ncbi:MAG: hypothetical protein WBD96_03125, partial [Pseudolabrys sp.]
IGLRLHTRDAGKCRQRHRNNKSSHGPSPGLCALALRRLSKVSAAAVIEHVSVCPLDARGIHAIKVVIEDVE